MVRQMPTLPKKEILLRQQNEQRHEIPVDDDTVMVVYARDISFFDVQKSAQELLVIGKNGEISLDLESYWKYAFTNWIVRTEPELSTSELLDLKGHIGQRIAAVLPSPETVGKMLQGDFTSGGAQRLRVFSLVSQSPRLKTQKCNWSYGLTQQRHITIYH